MDMMIDLNYAGDPKGLPIKVEPPGSGSRDQPLLLTPVLAADALHDSYLPAARRFHLLDRNEREMKDLLMDVR